MKFAARALLLLILLAVLLGTGVPLYLRRSVAQHDGTIKAVVRAPVEITFDAKGIPQIWAKSDGDAFFAIGWMHASERLFQMELVRRLAKGELSEVFGPAAYDVDVKQRRIGFARRARSSALTPQARAAMQRYLDGVNGWIAQTPVLPPEFVILRLEPRPWTLEDCLAISFYQTWYSHELMDQDQRYQKIIEKLGMPARALAHAGHPWSPSTVPDLSMANASNSWVVAPANSSTHAALHAADPHLSVDQAPGLWYLAGLHSEEGLNIVGATYAGAPFVVMGHNDDIAFSFTVASVDVIDTYDDRAKGAPVREQIRVKGEAPRVVEIFQGTRGVMLDEKTSMHWAGFDFAPSGLTEAGLRLQKAKTFDEFRRAVTGFGALDANWIYSDRAGNIGYQLGAPVPIREHDTYVRQSSTDPRSAWRGYRALDETPHALNPSRGYLASSNNQIVSKSWPYEIPGFYDPYRITRVTTLLPGRQTPEAMHAMQLDLVSGLALRWKGLAAAGAPPAEARLLNGWDGSVSADSRAAALFETWWRRMPNAVFADELGEEWDAGRVLLDEALTSGIAIDDTRTPRVETKNEISARAMREAIPLAAGRTWGEACTLLIQHPLARVKILDWLLHLNRGPLPGNGDPGSLRANFYSAHDGAKTFRAHVGPSMRFVLDWSDPDSFSLTGALGQSGNPFSDHYDDFLEMAQQGRSWTVPFTKEKVFAKKASLLVLTP